MSKINDSKAYNVINMFADMHKNDIYRYKDLQELADVSERSFKDYIKTIKEAIDYLKLPYILRYDSIKEGYQLIELPDFETNEFPKMPADKANEFMLFYIFSLLYRHAHFNHTVFDLLYPGHKKETFYRTIETLRTAISIGMNMDLKYNKNNKSYEIVDYSDYDYYDDEEDW